MNRDDLIKIIAALEEGRAVELTPEMVPAFNPASVPAFTDAAKGAFDETGALSAEYLNPDALAAISQSLTSADIDTFKRALRAIDEGDIAWLGFKVVFDPDQATSNVDNDVTKKYGDVGSADGLPLVFFCNDAKEIVCSREPSPRDIFQMKDVTRGPSMHNKQFDGLVWTSVALFEKIRVWLLGASDVACELAPLLQHVGFDVVAVDYDSSYLNPARFPNCERILFSQGNFDDLKNLHASPKDYVCVLTRGHMFDPESCLWAISQGCHYVGMMGCSGKNSTVHDLCVSRGMTETQWDSIVRPIGLKFGAKTPAELAIAIAGQLIDVRYKQRYSEEMRTKHDASLGF